ncbi:putative transcription factor [Rosellinia necatrix]|uniref:Putative transcription factor n=1 Tax=Rosellinia necatrix TaxID=77044 RepID=A0A1S7UKZ8_ROSNE|nr:putative transcription factor [Rosellinia necatrix]
MASNTATRPIADHVAQSLAAFASIDAVDVRAELGGSQLICVQTVSDQLSRFKLWAGNIGAHRVGRSSLDHRLRDSSHLHTQVMRLLDDLIASLNQVRSILSGETLPWDQDPGEADGIDEELDEELEDLLLLDENFEFDTELSQLTKGIADTIGNLLRLSISLRNPAPHDHFMSTEYAKAGYFEEHDKAHVNAKFPRVSQTLAVRLGEALSRKRQYFRYREAHHEKLGHGLFNSERSEAGAQSTVASSIPQAMRDPGAVPRALDEDERSDAAFSQTSFATTAPDSGRLRIPSLPKRSYDGPFECPFCFMLISVSSAQQWKKHVLSDLRPYICLAEDCPTASREYDRRHEWMNHVLQEHWKSWACPYQCGLNYTTETNLRQHVTNIHGYVTEMELDVIIGRCGRTQSPSSSSPVQCPLCQDTLESVQQYRWHVGRHQVDLSLFALPKSEEDDGESEEQNENQGSISTRSRIDSRVDMIVTETHKLVRRALEKLHDYEPKTKMHPELYAAPNVPEETGVGEQDGYISYKTPYESTSPRHPNSNASSTASHNSDRGDKANREHLGEETRSPLRDVSVKGTTESLDLAVLKEEAKIPISEILESQRIDELKKQEREDKPANLIPAAGWSQLDDDDISVRVRRIKERVKELVAESAPPEGADKPQ